jgi:hypothetical protein
MPKTVENVKNLVDALERIRYLEEKLQTARIDAVREVVGSLQVEGSDFYYNVPNDYGSVTVTLTTGKGNPWELFRGPEVKANHAGGVRGTGRYHLNEALLPVILSGLDCAKQNDFKLLAEIGTQHEPAP